MSMFQSLSFMVSHTNEIVGSFSCIHSRMVIGMLSLIRVSHVFTIFFLTSFGANGSPSGPTSSILYLTLSANFLVGPRFGLVEEWPDPDPEGYMKKEC